MQDYFLAHFNVARPLGKFSIQLDESRYFFAELQQLFQREDLHDDLLWHRHGMRASDGRPLDYFEIASLNTEGADNPHFYTIAGWRNASALHRFAYRDRQHVENMRRLRHWIDRSDGANMVMWWARKDVRISLDMAWERLERIRADGPTPFAFSLNTRFDPPGLFQVA